MPRIDFKEARSIGIATLEDEQVAMNATDPKKLGPWDICLKCWRDNKLHSNLEHTSYLLPSYSPGSTQCLVCNRYLTPKDDPPTHNAKEGDNATEFIDSLPLGFIEGLKQGPAIMNESQPGAPLTELEEYCLKLDNDIKAFEATIKQNARETERLLISTKVAVAAIEATQIVLDKHREEPEHI